MIFPSALLVLCTFTVILYFTRSLCGRQSRPVIERLFFHSLESIYFAADSILLDVTIKVPQTLFDFTSCSQYITIFIKIDPETLQKPSFWCIFWLNLKTIFHSMISKLKISSWSKDYLDPSMKAVQTLHGFCGFAEDM